MERSLRKILLGYQSFRNKYVHGDNSIMQQLSNKGQQPQIMVVACSDSRVDPALILQCDPGDLFVVRDVANIIPPYGHDSAPQGVSAALEFGVCALNVKHLIILGHSQCGGIHALLNKDKTPPNEFITAWVSLIHLDASEDLDVDSCSKLALKQSCKNALTFPWLKERVDQGQLILHLWFFDIKDGRIFICSDNISGCHPLEAEWLANAELGLSVCMK